jgi:hypothetical protein
MRLKYTAGRRAGKFGNAALDLAGIAHADWSQLNPDGRCHGLDGTPLAGAGGIGAIPKDRHSRHARRYFFQQLQPFPTDAVFRIGKAGGVAAWPR